MNDNNRNLTVKAGADNLWAITLSGPGGVAPGYQPGDAILCDVYPGLGQPALFSLTGTWTDAPNGKLTLAIAAASTASVEPGEYPIELWIVTSSPAARISGFPPGATLTVEASAGTDPTLATYVTYRRLRELCPWVDLCFDPQRHLAGFLRERASARATLDNIILNLYRGSSSGLFSSLTVAANSWAGGGNRRSMIHSVVMKGYLDANKLVVSDGVAKINAWLAAAEIGRQQVGVANQYVSYGQACAEWASAEISRTVAAIDLAGDGVGQIAVHLGSANVFHT